MVAASPDVPLDGLWRQHIAWDGVALRSDTVRSGREFGRMGFFSLRVRRPLRAATVTLLLISALISKPCGVAGQALLPPI